MWYFKREVILTKDNLVRTNCNVCKVCVAFVVSQKLSNIFS
jgi:hypothetical protein